VARVRGAHNARKAGLTALLHLAIGLQTGQPSDREISPDDNGKRDAAREHNADRQLPSRHFREMLTHAMSLSRATSAMRKMDSLEVMAALVRLNASAIDSVERFWAVMASSRSSSSSVQEREIFLSFATIAVEFREVRHQR
jgi:hypothetical protein